ncbi:MAG TPA: FAD-dependent oxidoreductase [Longimicrobium sp.]
MPESYGESIPDRADLIIVGAGMAGLYCAWRYLEKNPGQRVVILERLNRPGGRLQTDLINLKASDGQPVVVRDEEGGMRFNYHMQELMALFQALDLCDEIVPFPMSGNNNRYLFRGRGFTYEEAMEKPQVWSELFRLSPEERNRQPVMLLEEAYHRVVRANHHEPPENPTPKFWQRLRMEFTWKGTPLYRWQLWGLLRDMGHTEECCAMLAQTLGFESPFWSTMNAGEAFQLMEDFPQNPTYFTFEKGYGTLTDALVRRVEGQKGQIFVSTNVDALVEHEGGFEAQLTQAPEYVSASPSVPGGTRATIRAPQIILAVARGALETLFATSPVLNQRHSTDRKKQERANQLWKDLQTTTDQRLLKINLYFERSWWQELDVPVAYGPSFTDLPVNAVYPFYSLRGVEQDRKDTSPPPPDLPAALTIYCDWDNTNFWQGLQSVGELFDSPEQRKHNEAKPQTMFAASNAVVAEALRLFGELYNTPHVPQPILTSYRLWDGQSDFGYAVHQWALDARDEEVIPRLVEPFENIYTCNEAYSDMQGWVNGSIRSADLVLQKLGIEPLANQGCPAPATPAAAKRHHPAGLWGMSVRPAHGAS